MSVYKRPDSPFYKYDFQYKGQRFSGSTERTSKRDAEKVEAEVRARAKREYNAGRKPRDAAMTLDEALGRYWDEKGQFSVAPRQVEWSTNWLLDHFGENKLLRDITDADVAAMVAKRRTEPVRNVLADRTSGKKKTTKLVSAAAVNRSVLEPLKRVMLRARDIWGEPIKPIAWKTHKLQEPRERVRSMSEAEEDALFAKLPPNYRPLVLFAATTGLRATACVTLTWGQIDGPNLRITFTNKGGKERHVPITESLLGMLTGIKPKGARDGEAVFRNESGEPASYRAYYAAFQTACRKAGISNLRPHDMRHTTATRLLKKTGNLKLVQTLLCHSDISTTAKYAHVLDDDVRMAMDAVSVRKLTPVSHTGGD